MTYEEALSFKKERSEFMFIGDEKYWLFVTPKDETDFHNYLSFYRTHKKKDEMAKLFSTNNEYQVCAIWTNTVDVLYKRLT